jgi:hypothetical protein
VSAVRNFIERSAAMLTLKEAMDSAHSECDCRLCETIRVLVAALKAGGGEPPAPNSASLAIALLAEAVDSIPHCSGVPYNCLACRIHAFLAAHQQAGG